MKRVFCLISMTLLAFAVGCAPSEKKEDAPPPPKAPVAEAPASQQPESAKKVVEGYQKGLVTAIDKAKLAQARTDLGAIKVAIESYYVDKQNFPTSLDDIKSLLRPGIDLSLFAYDPATGNVTTK
jgi:hypothetical protein